MGERAGGGKGHGRGVGGWGGLPAGRPAGLHARAAPPAVPAQTPGAPSATSAPPPPTPLLPRALAWVSRALGRCGSCSSAPVPLAPRAVWGARPAPRAPPSKESETPESSRRFETPGPFGSPESHGGLLQSRVGDSKTARVRSRFQNRAGGGLKAPATDTPRAARQAHATGPPWGPAAFQAP